MTDQAHVESLLIAMTVKCRACDAEVGVKCTFPPDVRGTTVVLCGTDCDYHVIRWLDATRPEYGTGTLGKPCSIEGMHAKGEAMARYRKGEKS